MRKPNRVRLSGKTKTKQPAIIGIDQPDADRYRVIGPLPRDVSYQWIAETVNHSRDLAQTAYARMQDGGWRAVPAKRHPKMPRDAAGRIVIGGQVLMERPKQLSDAARQEEVDCARSLFSQHSSQSNNKVGGGYPDYSNRYGEIAPAGAVDTLRPRFEKEAAAAKTALGAVDGNVYAEFNITIGLTLTDREIEAAIFLGLTPQEYARRKFIMCGHVLQARSFVLGSTPKIKVFDLVRLNTESEQ